MPNYTPGWTDLYVTASHANPAEGSQMQSGVGNSIVAYGQQVDQARHSLHNKAVDASCCKPCQCHMRSSNLVCMGSMPAVLTQQQINKASCTARPATLLPVLMYSSCAYKTCADCTAAARTRHVLTVPSAGDCGGCGRQGRQRVAQPDSL